MGTSAGRAPGDEEAATGQGNAPRRSALTALHDRHRREVLQLLCTAPDGVTNEQLQERTELARSSITTLLKRLEPVLVSRSEESGSPGRPRLRHAIAPQIGVVVGLDVGRTRLYGALADLAGTVLDEPLDEELIEGMPPDAPEAALAAARSMITRLLREHRRTRAHVAAVGVTLPAPIVDGMPDPRDDTMQAWRSFGVQRIAAGLFVPPSAVTLVNEGAAALLAERRWGAARASPEVLYVEWSSGVAASALLAGEIRAGATGTGGAVGHLVPQLTRRQVSLLGLRDAPLERPCPRCHRIGCVEQLVGGLRLRRLLEVETAEEALARVMDDPYAAEVARAAAELLGRAIGAGVTILDVPRVILGGFFVPASDPFLMDPVRSGIRAVTDRDVEVVHGQAELAALRGAHDAALAHGRVSYLLRLANR